MNLRVLCLVALFLSTLSYSQKKEEEEIKEFFWGENDEFKNVTEVPEKWANESAVIIYKNLNHDYHKFFKNVTYGRSTRERIKLLDKAAVAEYSELTFSTKLKSSKGFSLFNEDASSIIGLKLIKPDGTEKEIDVKNEVVVVDGVTKLAISNLEVGDILDYYSYREKPYTWYDAINFDSNEVVIASEYPIMNYKFYLETENDFFISFSSINGAPDLTEIITDKNRLRKYELNAQNLEKRDFPRWFYPMVEMPAYRFHVYYASKGKFEKRAKAFISEKENIIKSNVTKEEVLGYYDDMLQADGDIKPVLKYLKEQSFSTDAEKASAAYYYMRHIYFTQYIEASYLMEADIVNYPFSYYKSPFIIDKYGEFTRNFTQVLKKLEIDYDIVIGKNRYDGPLEELLLESNLHSLIRVNTQPKLYFSKFEPHKSSNQFSSDLEGVNVYLLSSVKNKIKDVSADKLPVSKASDNVERSEISLKIHEDFTGVSMENTYKISGNQKNDAQIDRMYYEDYVYEDYERFGTEPFLELVNKKKDKERFRKEMEALSIKIKEKMKERFEKSVASELNIPEVENYDFKIVETGRYGADSDFIYTEKYDAKNTLIKKAGSNYILEIGKLIGGQVDIDEKERSRKENIYMQYPRTYTNKIVLEIPKGYSVSGFEKLNSSSENSTGSFISSAKIEGNTLVVEASKVYSSNFESNSNWSKMIEFLELANQFTNEKILLKKT